MLIKTFSYVELNKSVISIEVVKTMTRNLIIMTPLLIFSRYIHTSVEGAVASWLVRSSLDRVVRVRTLIGAIELSS